jgi:hypothetical protein
MPRRDVQLQQKQTGYLLTLRRRSEVALTIEPFSNYTRSGRLRELALNFTMRWLTQRCRPSSFDGVIRTEGGYSWVVRQYF